VDSPEPTEIFPVNPDGAEGLRDQAAACRRLAAQARTRAGNTSMTALAEHFDEQARRIDQAEFSNGTGNGATQEVTK
jgi:type IV secretory pathway VirB9-like protein